jgi:hypothetical protein
MTTIERGCMRQGTGVCRSVRKGWCLFACAYATDGEIADACAASLKGHLENYNVTLREIRITSDNGS